MAAAAKQKKASAEIEAQIERYKPTKEDDPASSGTLWHLNNHGMLYEAIARQAEKDDLSVDDGAVIITKITAWEVMADAQRNGVTF